MLITTKLNSQFNYNNISHTPWVADCFELVDIRYGNTAPTLNTFLFKRGDFFFLVYPYKSQRNDQYNRLNIIDSNKNSVVISTCHDSLIIGRTYYLKLFRSKTNFMLFRGNLTVNWGHGENYVPEFDDFGSFENVYYSPSITDQRTYCEKTIISYQGQIIEHDTESKCNTKLRCNTESK